MNNILLSLIVASFLFNCSQYDNPANTVKRDMIITGTSTPENLLQLTFDNDSRSDIVVWRPSNGKWYIRKSSEN